MDTLKAVEYIEKNKNFLFPNKKYSSENVENALLAAPESFEMTLGSVPFKDPSTAMLLSVVLGFFGFDRLYFGNIIMCLFKLVTFGGFGLLWILDALTAKNRCRTYNCKKLMQSISDPSVGARMQNTNARINQTLNTAKTLAPEIIKAGKGWGNTFRDDV